MSTDAVTPLRQRMIEDTTRANSVHTRSEATSPAAGVSLQFQADRPIRPHRTTFVVSSCTWLIRA